MKRSEVDNKYKWKLEDLFASEELFEQQFDYVKNSFGDIEAYRGKLNNAEEILACFTKTDEIARIIEKLYCYAKMRKDEDGKVTKYIGLSDRAESLYVEFSSSLSWINPALSALGEEKLLALAKEKILKDYDFTLAEIARESKYILSEKEEKLLAMSANATGCFQNIFNVIDNVELPLKKILVDGKETQLSHGIYSLLLQSRDVAVRKKAFEGMYGAYKSLIGTITAIYSGNVKKNIFYTKARGFGSTLERMMYGDNVPKEVYTNLIESVDSALPKLHEYVAYRASVLGEINMYDMYVPLVENAEYAMDYEDAYKVVLSALAPMGEEYISLLKEGYKSGWIDVVETDGKRSGAYSWGSYGTHPYVLLNYQKTTHDLFTIAHEMGHALHSHYSNLAQPYPKSSYAIFVAEVASTVNEVLLLKYLIARETDINKKKYLLSYYLDMFRTTLFRQTMFSEFEAKAHEMEENGAPLTEEALSDMYYALNQKYYGDSVIHNEEIRYEWARIPHFYTAFYVYKYATGLTSSVSLARRILSGDTASYYRFLSSGGSKSPYEILCDCGVDLAQSEPYEVAMAEFEATLEELKSIG